jgi:hypothetical protein
VGRAAPAADVILGRQYLALLDRDRMLPDSAALSTRPVRRSRQRAAATSNPSPAGRNRWPCKQMMVVRFTRTQDRPTESIPLSALQIDKQRRGTQNLAAIRLTPPASGQPAGEVDRQPGRPALDSSQRPIPHLFRVERRWRRRHRTHRLPPREPIWLAFHPCIRAKSCAPNSSSRWVSAHTDWPRPSTYRRPA